MSSDAHAEALKAYLTAQTPAFQGAPTEALDLDEVKKRKADGALPYNYIEFYLSRRFGGNVRGDTRDTNLRRMSLRIVCYSPTNGRAIEDAIFAAFEHTLVDLGDVSVLVEFESGGGAFELKEGVYVGQLSDWTFGI